MEIVVPMPIGIRRSPQMELNRTAPQTQKDLWQVVTITRDESRGNGSFSRYLTGLLGRRSRGGIGACVCVFFPTHLFYGKVSRVPHQVILMAL
jgi:hypothetical protein